jgi:hypothetical protein
MRHPLSKPSFTMKWRYTGIMMDRDFGGQGFWWTGILVDRDYDIQG